MSKVMIIMGSSSDRSKIEPAIWPLVGVVDTEIHVMSAYRTPDELRKLVIDSDADIFIAGASMSAALPGTIAALTVKPVIGIPLSNARLDGLDALFTVSQMPKGVPVATVAIDSAENAAILALEILGLHNQRAEDTLYGMREDMRQRIVKIDRQYVENIQARKNEYAREHAETK